MSDINHYATKIILAPFLITAKITGATSTPAIFEYAIRSPFVGDNTNKGNKGNKGKTSPRGC